MIPLGKVLGRFISESSQSQHDITLNSFPLDQAASLVLYAELAQYHLESSPR